MRVEPFWLGVYIVAFGYSMEVRAHFLSPKWPRYIPGWHVLCCGLFDIWLPRKATL